MLDQRERAAARPTGNPTEASRDAAATDDTKQRVVSTPQAPAPGTQTQPGTQQQRQQDTPPPREPSQTTQETSIPGPLSQRSVSPIEGADHASQGTMPEPHGQVLPADPADGKAHGTLMGPLEYEMHVDPAEGEVRGQTLMGFHGHDTPKDEETAEGTEG
jgi:hypothetical protein